MVLSSSVSFEMVAFGPDVRRLLSIDFGIGGEGDVSGRETFEARIIPLTDVPAPACLSGYVDLLTVDSSTTQTVTVTLGTTTVAITLES